MLPVLSLNSAGMSLPFLSLAVTFVSEFLFATIIPVSCLPSPGSISLGLPAKVG